MKLTKLKEYFADNLSFNHDDHQADIERSIQIATCALLVEMASIDSEFDDEERTRINRYFKKEYGLTDDQIAEIMSLAKNELDNRIDLWGFTNLINQHYDNEHKRKIIGIIWDVIYADGNLSAHEDYLIHKLYKMLNLTHGDMIEAKMKALEKRNSS